MLDLQPRKLGAAYQPCEPVELGVPLSHHGAKPSDALQHQTMGAVYLS